MVSTNPPFKAFKSKNFANLTGFVATRILVRIFLSEEKQDFLLDKPKGSTYAEQLKKTPDTKQDLSGLGRQYRYILNSRDPRQGKIHPDKC